MPRVRDLWTRLVRVALRKERTGAGAYGRPGSGIAGAQQITQILSSISNNGLKRTTACDDEHGTRVMQTWLEHLMTGE
ncbi:hypothetical protein F0562_001705 [Nyssa sinensis]|uniref:Uncharacterized protein n=1 Tax=Nyssa sinensis TaxID=561372 RepID=A0A5J5C8X1_9ASTE|nr:hypothetical protein F0562_001705 [Nyssa sinensis]